MSGSPQQALERLKELATTGALARWCAERSIEALVVFGSAAESDRAAVARDLDVAVVLAPSAEAGVLGVVNALTDLLGCDAVDVLDLGRADPVAQEQALVGTIWLHERVPGTLAALLDRATRLRMDTAWLRALDLELMAGS